MSITVYMVVRLGGGDAGPPPAAGRLGGVLVRLGGGVLGRCRLFGSSGYRLATVLWAISGTSSNSRNAARMCASTFGARSKNSSFSQDSNLALTR